MSYEAENGNLAGNWESVSGLKWTGGGIGESHLNPTRVEGSL